VPGPRSRPPDLRSPAEIARCAGQALAPGRPASPPRIGRQQPGQQAAAPRRDLAPDRPAAPASAVNPGVNPPGHSVGIIPWR